MTMKDKAREALASFEERFGAMEAADLLALFGGKVDALTGAQLDQLVKACSFAPGSWDMAGAAKRAKIASTEEIYAHWNRQR